MHVHLTLTIMKSIENSTEFWTSFQDFEDAYFKWSNFFVQTNKEKMLISEMFFLLGHYKTTARKMEAKLVFKK